MCVCYYINTYQYISVAHQHLMLASSVNHAGTSTPSDSHLRKGTSQMRRTGRGRSDDRRGRERERER